MVLGLLVIREVQKVGDAGLDVLFSGRIGHRWLRLNLKGDKERGEGHPGGGVVISHCFRDHYFQDTFLPSGPAQLLEGSETSGKTVLLQWSNILGPVFSSSIIHNPITTLRVTTEVPGPHIKELNVLLTCNKSHCAEITHNISSKTRKTIVERAAQLAIRVTSLNARLHSEENE
ncbi:60S ribosomal protein L32 [Myotis davidii]|uniref:60S ribosomal protein L32 n=1 Tax=Myotis davidii TaxID=225400 RepID=L5LWK5_MYODS|nr:60S ribosomal protein L32 [Myotis davidii]